MQRAIWGVPISGGNLHEDDGLFRVYAYCHDDTRHLSSARRFPAGIGGKNRCGRQEEIQKLKPGDLLFFGRRREDGSKRVTHVGLYIGDDRFIHESGTVFIQSLNPEHENYSKYRHDQFLHAKDVIHHVGEYGVQHILDNPMFSEKRSSE
ncbi:MAG: NlpC/P60 family protein [Candidatus Marinimicrobia bacterium]|nr:NlpC/P60 family protein [Candidatus Neomarinimicrobiota bacterium]